MCMINATTKEHDMANRDYDAIASELTHAFQRHTLIWNARNVLRSQCRPMLTAEEFKTKDAAMTAEIEELETKQAELEAERKAFMAALIRKGN